MPNVEHIKFQGDANFATVFGLAPKLLHVEWDSNQNSMRAIDKFLTQSAAHDTLEVFTIHGGSYFSVGNLCTFFTALITEMQPSDKEHNSFVDLLFSCLNLANFPSLKSLHLAEYKWPKVE